MSTVLSMDVEGDTVTIDTKLFIEEVKRSNDILAQIESLKQDHKDIIESVFDTTKLPKKYVGKYLKARFKAETKKPKQDAAIFETLDQAVDN